MAKAMCILILLTENFLTLDIAIFNRCIQQDRAYVHLENLISLKAIAKHNKKNAKDSLLALSLIRYSQRDVVVRAFVKIAYS